MRIEYPLVLRETTLSPSTEWMPQCEGWIVLRIAEGCGYGLCKGTARELNEGDGFMESVEAGVSVRSSQLGLVRLQFFQVEPEHITGLLTVDESRRLQTAAGNGASAIFFKASDAVGREFSSLATRADDPSLSVRCAFLQLWAGGVKNLLGTFVHQPESDRSLRSRFQQLVQRIPETELFSYSLSALAKQLGCSERHLGRLFRRELGIPFRNHQIEMRLQHARMLLGNPGIKLAQVAAKIGYQRPGLFNAAFKKRFGATPGEWRKKIAEERPGIGSASRHVDC